MKRIALLILITCPLWILSCSKSNVCDNIEIPEGDIIQPEYYKIANAVLRFNDNSSKYHHIGQLSDRALDKDYIENIQSQFTAEIKSSVIDQYVEVNATKSLWMDQFAGSRKLISEEEFDCFKENRTFYTQEYDSSSGYFRFSKPVVFGENRAIIEYSVRCGGECAAGFIATFQKIGPLWYVVDNINTWIS
ncbi:MAG: hypothetical protein P1U56_10620 [Saprospiraceae bacterium]|nr:hypothetical protein [Saprospiraceae bacterium]